jgi:hypothetical protein
LPREQTDALSLQDHTFLYILSNVDQYQTEILTQLPLHMRRRLLSAVPPFRLYQLERMSIARDIDTDEIWEELSQQQGYIWGEYMKDKPSNHPTPTGVRKRESPRVCFVNYLSHLLFNEMNRDYACKRITELLHAIHVDMLEPSVANGFIYGRVSSLFMFQPPYYLIPFRCQNLTERELYWLLHVNRLLPTSLEMYTYNIEFSPLWNQDLISQGMMRRLMAKLSFLRIYSHSYRTIPLEDIVDAVTHSSKYRDPPSNMGSLKHLELLRADDRDLLTLSPYFSKPNGYSNLTSLTISLRPVTFLQATRHLTPVIRHQLNTLQHLELRGFTCTMHHNRIQLCDFMFFSSLASFILQPRFRSLVLNGFKDLPWEMLKMLLQASFRTVPSHKQTMTFENVKVVTKGELPKCLDEDAGIEGNDEHDFDARKDRENQFCPASESRCLEHKQIHFLDTQIPFRALDWLLSIDGVYLNTLEFTRVNINTDAAYYGFQIIEEGPDGVGWATVGSTIPAPNQKQLKERLMHHEQFECRVFVWEAVRTESIMCV